MTINSEKNVSQALLRLCRTQLALVLIGAITVTFGEPGVAATTPYYAKAVHAIYDGPIDRNSFPLLSDFRGSPKHMGVITYANGEIANEPGMILDLKRANPRNPSKNTFESYANDSGRVRALAQGSGGGRTPIANGIGGEWRYFDEHRALLVWKNIYTKGSGNEKVTAEILASYLTLSAGQGPAGEDTTVQEPYASVRVEVLVMLPASEGLAFGEDAYTPDNGISQEAKIQGYPLFYPNRFAYSRSGSSDMSAPADGYDPGPLKMNFTIEPTKDLARLDIPRQTVELDLSRIEEGQEYAVLYFIDARAGTWSDNAGAGSYFADPVAAGGDQGGINIVITDEAVTEPLTRRCSEALDPDRFTDNMDGTVNDQRTGLMWQRCPVGFLTDDNGTPGVLSDDACSEDATAVAQNNWAASLGLAGDNQLASYSDWRLPNVKELESLTSHCFTRTIEPDWFPDVPGPENYWSSTPARNDGTDPVGQALQIELGNGDIQPRSRITPALVRLVRNSAAGPIAGLAQMRAQSASIVEGDSGTATLQFAVELSQAIDSAVMVDYNVASANDHAINTVDFGAVSGTVTFAPGETRKTIPVTIYGDVEAELTERIGLTLSNPSGPIRIARPFATGHIIDDEPVISGMDRAHQVKEGDVGERLQINIPVQLSKSAESTVFVDYDLTSGSAELGVDFEDASGTLSFALGEDTAVIEVTLIGDNDAENDESFIVQFSNPLGAKFGRSLGDAQQQTVTLIDDDGPPTLMALNDTGIFECTDGTTPGQACPQAGHPGQDAETGRDADPTINGNDTDGKVGFSFTKLDDSGVPLSDQFASPICVLDEVTGLTWEVKDTLPNLNDPGYSYSWYSSSAVNDGGDPGTENGGNCSDSVNCDTEKFVAAVNAENYCGFNDWRLPTIEEQVSLAHMNLSQLNHDFRGFYGNSFFKMKLDSASRRGLWSSTPVAGSGGSQAWQLSDTGINVDAKSRANRIRLVRGGL